MRLSLYSSASGAAAQQSKIDVIANNIANANTYGYKNKTATFSDLLYTHMRVDEPGQEKIQNGIGARLDKTNTNYNPGSVQETSNLLDFAIEGEGFFAVQNPQTQEISYTRAGNFVLSEAINGSFYLVTSKGDFVLDRQNNIIQVQSLQQSFDNIAVYDFENKEGMLSVGDTNFIPVEKNGDPILMDSVPLQGRIEWSNMELSEEFTRLIEAQRTYTMNLKMVTTSDEVIQEINALRR